MVKITSAVAGAVAFAAVASAATVNSPPSLTQCQPAAITWSGATGTVRLNILPGGQVSAAPLESLPSQSGASGTYVWTVNIASGTNITISILDDSGVANYASPLVVLASSDSSCLNAAATGSTVSGSATSSGTSSRASSSSAAASTSAMSSSAMSSSSSRASSSSTSSAASAATTSATPNGAVGSFSPATAGLTVIALAGALLPFL